MRLGVLFVVLAGALALGIGCGGGDDEALPSPTAPPPTPPVSASSLLQQLNDAINGGDVAAAMALFADDASESGPLCSPCVGKAAIQTDIEYYTTLGNVSFSACTTEVSGNTATARCESRSNGTRTQGIDRVIVTRTLEAQGGKISVIRSWVFDISDQQTATYWAANGPALYQQYLDSINRGDVAAAMALFADDAVFEAGPACSPAPCAGRDAIQQEIERQVADEVNLTSTKAQLVGPLSVVHTVTDILEISTGSGEPTSASIALELKDGKIASVRLETASGE